MSTRHVILYCNLDMVTRGISYRLDFVCLLSVSALHLFLVLELPREFKKNFGKGCYLPVIKLMTKHLHVE